MLFNSFAFFGFFAIVLIVYPRLPLRGQNIFLLIASYFFYCWWDWRFSGLLLLSTILDYLFALSIYGASSTHRRKLVLFLSVVINLLILCFFKYFNFFSASMAGFLSLFGFEPNLFVLQVILPVGISFYTFQSMSYTIDIYRGELVPTRSFVEFALCLSFFPHLVAGPILRASIVLPQVQRPRTVTKDKVLSGLNLMLIGFFKKIAIADSLAPLANNAFANSGSLSSGELLSGLYAFSIQIYCDFSGYTDIARGAARLLGFELPENFGAPYLSRNITEFWRRWHISLSSWLRDYLYISLGGNRMGTKRTYINLLLTMFLGGLWHGAAGTFIVWGLMHGVFLAMHKLFLLNRKLHTSVSHDLIEKGRYLINILVTFHLVALTWIFFRAANCSDAWTFLMGILRHNFLYNISIPVLFAGAMVFLIDYIQTQKGTHTWIAELPSLIRVVAVIFLTVSTLAAAIHHTDTTTPFIYFQF